MGVYIKGMELPKSCYECPVRKRNGMDIVCPLLEEEFSVANVNILFYRLRNCPLIEVPSRWISVKERLPENNTRVIGFMAWKAMTAVERQNNKWYSIDHLESLPDEAVTHWMPLPEPPKEVDNG